MKSLRRRDMGVLLESLSSWRAWIEMGNPNVIYAGEIVALLMESVD